MHWEKKICIRITLRRLVGALVTASIVVNLAIVGAAFGAASPPTAPVLDLASVTASATDTPVGVTLTPSGSATLTLAPTQTSTSSATHTPTPTQSSTPSPTLTSCVKRFDWPIYYIRRGDTLFALALATGSTVQELMLANCLEGSRIIAGQPLHVPRLPATPTPTDTPTSVTPDTPTGFEILATMTCAPPFSVSFAVRAFDPDTILSLTVLLYSIQGTVIAEIPMTWNGVSYAGSISLSEPHTVAEIATYRFRAVDSPGNVTISQPYSERSDSCDITRQSS
jgi:LysM repeat protein